MNELNTLFHDLLFLPPQASTVARRIDTLHYVVITTTMLGAFLVFAVGVGFVIRYRSGGRPTPVTPRVTAPGWLEGTFIAGTLLLFLAFWQIGFRQFVQVTTAPAGAMEVYVSAKQWMWRFTYPGGQTSIDVLYVPAGKPVRLIMTSRDVIHSLYVPDFRVKQDVVPGRATALWFQAIEPGRSEILCAEYCGQAHSMMRGEVVVLSPADWERWLAGATEPMAAPRPLPPDDPFVATGVSEPGQPTDLPSEGVRAAAKYGCVRCHTLDGAAHIGPSWVGLYGARRVFTDGTSAVADEAYLTESMMDPAVHVVAGFKPVMPSYQGILEPGDTAAIVELIRSLQHRALGPHVPGLDEVKP